MAFTFDASGNTKLGVAGTTTTLAHTVGAGTHRLLTVILIKSLDTNPPTAVTYGGVALTLAVEKVESTGLTDCIIQIWYLIDPTAGAANIVATHTSSTAVRLIAASFTSDGTPAYDAASDAVTTAAQVASDLTTVTVTPANAGSLIVEGTLVRNASPQTAVGASQTALVNVDEGAFQSMSSYALAMPASAYGMTHFAAAWTTGDEYAGAGTAFYEAASATTVAVPVSTASVTASTPTIQAKVPAPVSAVSAAAPTPTIRAVVPVPVSAVSGNALAPTTRLVVAVPVAAVAVAALAPTVVGPSETIAIPVAGIAVAAPAPAIRAVVAVPVAAITADALAPTIQVIVGVPVAEIAVAALDPEVAVIFVPPVFHAPRLRPLVSTSFVGIGRRGIVAPIRTRSRMSSRVAGLSGVIDE